MADIKTTYPSGATASVQFTGTMPDIIAVLLVSPTVFHCEPSGSYLISVTWDAGSISFPLGPAEQRRLAINYQGWKNGQVLEVFPIEFRYGGVLYRLELSAAVLQLIFTRIDTFDGSDHTSITGPMRLVFLEEVYRAGDYGNAMGTPTVGGWDG